MNSQVRIRLRSDDLGELEAELREREALFLPYTFPAPELSFLPALELGKLIWIVRPDDRDLVRLKHIPQQGYWVIDQVRSPVVEFSHSGPDSELGEGRLQFHTNYWADDDTKVAFPDGFVTWARDILQWVRGRYTGA